MLTKTIITKITSLVVTAIAACAIALAAPLSAAYAQEGTPPPAQGNNHARLEFRLKQLKLMLEGQQNRLDLANLAAEEAQDRIDVLKAEGKDTASLESALATFNGRLDEAQVKHDEAQDILDGHAGFDANGKVTDADQARATLQSAGDALRESQRILKDAGRAFRRAARDFRQANKPDSQQP